MAHPQSPVETGHGCHLKMNWQEPGFRAGMWRKLRENWWVDRHVLAWKDRHQQATA
jgi:hypothetical protein